MSENDRSGAPWPADGKPASFEDIVGPIRDLLDQAYVLERQPLADLDYQGLDRGSKHILPEVKDALTAEQLRYDDEDQGRDAADVILGLAVQLGIEQGRRTLADDLSSSVRLLAELAAHEEDPQRRTMLEQLLDDFRRWLPHDERPR